MTFKKHLSISLGLTFASVAAIGAIASDNDCDKIRQAISEYKYDYTAIISAAESLSILTYGNTLKFGCALKNKYEI